MSLEVSYKNRKIADLEGDADCTLKTAGKFCEGDISLALREAGAEPSGTVSITRNGTVNVRDYASAEVDVPNSYVAADEGKVVKNGVLVAQTARATEITENGTYDTTENNSVTVNVSGSSGGGSTSVLHGTNTPSPSLGNNGDIYLLHNSPSDQIQLDLSDWAVSKESAMTVTTAENLIETTYGSGSSIGAQAQKQYDLTNVNNITFTIGSGARSYNNYQSVRFRPMLIIRSSGSGYASNGLSSAINNTPHTGNENFYSSAFDAIITGESLIKTANTEKTVTVDVSEYTGDYYIAFCASGCDAYLKDVFFNLNGKITEAYAKINNSWQKLVGSIISNISTN